MGPLIARVQAILLRPKQEWPVIAAEPATASSLYQGYVMPLAAIGPVATVIGAAIFGVTVPFVGTYRAPIGSAIASAVVTYALTLAGTYVLALVIDALAPQFGATQDRTEALKVAAYGSTATWLAAGFAILPPLAPLQILGLYSLYLVYTGLPVLMKAPAERTVPYVVACVVALIVISLIAGVFASQLIRF